MPRKNPERLRFTPGFNYDLTPEIVDEMTDEYIGKLTKKQRHEVTKIKKTIEERKKAEAKAEEMRLEKLEKERKKQEGLEKKRIEEEKRLRRQNLEMEAKRKEQEQIECAKIKLAENRPVDSKSGGSGDASTAKKAANQVTNDSTPNSHKKIPFKMRLKDFLCDEFTGSVSGLITEQRELFIDLLNKKSKSEFDKLLLNCGYSRKTDRHPYQVVSDLIHSMEHDDTLQPEKTSACELRTALGTATVQSFNNYLNYISSNGTPEQCFMYSMVLLLIESEDGKYPLGFADFYADEKGLLLQTDNIAKNIKKFFIEMRIPWRDTPVVDIIAAIEEDSGRIKRFADYLLKDKSNVELDSIKERGLDATQATRIMIRETKNQLDVKDWYPITNSTSKDVIKFLEYINSDAAFNIQLVTKSGKRLTIDW